MAENSDKKATILIVDDSPTKIDVLVAILKEEYRIRVAPNGKRALQLAHSDSKPDLILLDIVMPEMDGFEVCRQLKSNPETADIPIIFATAMNDDNDEEKGLSLGAEDYITKPYSAAIVKKRVSNHLELKRYRDSQLP